MFRDTLVWPFAALKGYTVKAKSLKYGYVFQYSFQWGLYDNVYSCCDGPRGPQTGPACLCPGHFES